MGQKRDMGCGIIILLRKRREEMEERLREVLIERGKGKFVPYDKYAEENRELRDLLRERRRKLNDYEIGGASFSATCSRITICAI